MVKVYSTQNCPKCSMIKERLKDNNIEFENIDLSENKEQKDKLISKGFLSVPVIEIENNFMDFKQANKWIKESVGR